MQVIYTTFSFGRKHWNGKEKWLLFTYMLFHTFFPGVLWWSCLCAGIWAWAYQGDIWAPSLGPAREINVCSLSFLETKVLLASPACFMGIFCLWCEELGCNVQSDPVSKTEAQGNGIGFQIISVDNCIRVPLPSFPLMHLVCPAWSDRSLQHKDDAALSVSISWGLHSPGSSKH